MPRSPATNGTRCPICAKPAQPQWRPFCSKRCADVDLNRWFTGTYTVPVVENDDEVSTVPKSGDETA